MGGECSQKLRPRRGMLILSGAQRLSGSVENQPLYLNDLSPSLKLSPTPGRRGL